MCDKVKVAVRVRPLNKRENGNYNICTYLHVLGIVNERRHFRWCFVCFRGGHLLHSGGEGELHPAPFPPPAGGLQVQYTEQSKKIYKLETEV
jgi:hypothetical protein